MTLKLSSLVVACAVAVSGCTSTLRGAPADQYAPGVRPNLETIVFSERLNEDQVREALRAPSRASRNRVVLARMAEIDALYNEYESAILTESRGANFALSVGGLIAGLLGGFTTGGTSQIYSLIGGGISAVQTSYNKEVLTESTVQAFLSSMRANRARVRGEIYSNLQGDHTTYSIEAALSDLQRYRHAGTLAAGIVGLSEQAQLNDQRLSAIASDRGRDFFTATLPDDLSEQEIIERLTRSLTTDPASVDRYIAEAAPFGVRITAPDASTRRIQALQAIATSPAGTNRAVATRLGLI